MDHLLEKRQPGIDRRAGFGESDRDHRFREIGPRADPKRFAIQERRLPFFAAPEFVAHRIVDHPDDDFSAQTQRDRNAKMRDAVEEIHRAIERIDDPLMIARLVADDSFFAIKRVLRKTFEQDFCDQILGQHIDLELDVVRGRALTVSGCSKCARSNSPAARAASLRHLEIMHHDANLTDSAVLRREVFCAKKTGRRK